MCSIAGILIKNPNRKNFKMTTGKALTEILNATVHRGPDSAGWALYKKAIPGQIRMNFFNTNGSGKRENLSIILKILNEQNVSLISESILGCIYKVLVKYCDDIQKLSLVFGETTKLVSIGTSLEIIKDVGKAKELAEKYNIYDFNGTHGLGHTRLATESGVHPDTAHPFWASGFADICTVHNGQITNYWIMRRRLERKGMKFQTENDTELIAIYLAYQMSKGISLKNSLKTSLEDLDGTFSYLVATKNSIGYAKDKLAAKPMVKYEDEEIIAIASEEVGLNSLFPGKALDTTEPPPYTYGLWSL